MSRVPRRSAALLAIVATAPIWLGACGSDDAATTDAPDSVATESPGTEPETTTADTSDATETEATAVATDDPTSDTATEAEPRTIEHKFGNTTIEGVPERIVTIGLTDQDYVIALGFAPVGTSEWFGEQPGALFPWAIEALGDQPMPEAVLDIYEPDPEEIAALRPDLILAINSGLTQEQYDLLDEIAPTVAQPGEFPDYGAPWQEITERIGTALDREDEAEVLVGEVEAQLVAAAEENPSLADATGMLATDIAGDFWLYADGPAPNFLAALGLEIPEAADAALDSNDRSPTQLSDEQLDLLASDATVIGLYSGTTEDQLNGHPIYSQLDFVERGNTVPLLELSRANTAMSFGSVLSLPVAIEEMVPRLVAAVDGDPATEVAPTEVIAE
ncbi:ABC transporter substrate-binding protein [Ilumatobacter nonamiensis]|uniref:ABC transporter substrate-binding protein n=1 Tax=Ilumatobacter nonamiensis TaxID=467093 RepID=UPI00034AD25D|nr:ABC transporter substrate-binding protein [Ilumatobacter nonamiensis]